MTSVRVVLPANLSEEATGAEGSTLLMTRLLDEGCVGYSAEEFAVALERLGIIMGAGALDGGVSVDLDVPVRQLPAALGLLRAAITAPTLPEDQVRRIRQSRLAEIEHETSSAPHRAARELQRRLWAAGTRAAVPVGGTTESVSALTRADLLARHARLAPTGGTIVVAGHLAGLDIADLIEQSFGDWTSAAEPVAAPSAPVAASAGTRITVVDRPGSVQSEIMVAAPGPARSMPGWPRFPVLAYLLGGSPTARLDAVLREDKGWTYGLRTAARPRVVGGSFVTSGSVRADVTAPALATMLEILDPSGSSVAETELTAAVDFITRATPGRWATADVVADETAALGLEGLPWDYPQRTIEAMSVLTPDALMSAWTEVGANGWEVVVVGDAATQAPLIEALGVGPVSVVPL